MPEGNSQLVLFEASKIFFSFSSFFVRSQMDSEAALKTFELSNNIQTTTDAIYQFNNDEQQQILAQKPWTKE